MKREFEKRESDDQIKYHENHSKADYFKNQNENTKL
jgi:hypothetical protein